MHLAWSVTFWHIRFTPNFIVVLLLTPSCVQSSLLNLPVNPTCHIYFYSLWIIFCLVFLLLTYLLYYTHSEDTLSLYLISFYKIEHFIQYKYEYNDTHFNISDNKYVSHLKYVDNDKHIIQCTNKLKWININFHKGYVSIRTAIWCSGFIIFILLETF